MEGRAPWYMSSTEDRHLGGRGTEGKGQKEHLENQGHCPSAAPLLSHVEAINASPCSPRGEGEGLGTDLVPLQLCTGNAGQSPNPGQMLWPQTRFLPSSPDPFNFNVFSQKCGKAQGGPQNLTPAFSVRTVDCNGHEFPFRSMETEFDGDDLHLNPRQSLEPNPDRQKDGRKDDNDRQAKAEYHFNPLEETEGSVPCTSHKDHIGRPGLKEDD